MSTEARPRCRRANVERETGIEPATNSLEGCDSTTELLPPSRLASAAHSPLRRASPPSRSSSRESPPSRSSPVVAPASTGPRMACHPKLAAHRSRGERRMVAREGLEPSKAQGRQIYSLLRLTASLPRRCVVWLNSRTLWPLRWLALSPKRRRRESGGTSWRRDLNPRPADYKSAALPD